LSDITVPSWRARPEKSGPPRLLLAIAGGVLALAAIGGAVVWGVSRSGPRVVPVIEADPRPIKVRPDHAGGLVVPNQDQLVLEPIAIRRAAEKTQGTNSKLAAGPEAPQLDMLRQQAAPTTAQPAAAPPQAEPVPTALIAPTLPAPVPPSPVPPTSVPLAAAPAKPMATPAVAPPAKPVIAPVAKGKASVQLVAVDSEESAKAEWTRLAKRVPELAGFKPVIVKVERDGQAPVFRLRAGGLADAAAAKALCDLVRGKGGSCVASAG
jgi:hypothetical protein